MEGGVERQGQKWWKGELRDKDRKGWKGELRDKDRNKVELQRYK